MKFKHLDSAQIGREAAARFEFPEIDGCPWLEVRPAGESNRDFTQAILRQPDKQRLLRGKWTVEQIIQERASSIEPYSRHILTGNGGGWISEDGTEAIMPLSVEDRASLLKQLPPDLYDGLRKFCNDLTHFRD